MSEIVIAAVGDLMVKRYIISDARLSDGTYDFDPLFQKVAPFLKKADLTIGNLETTFAGTAETVRRKSSNPLFKCPDDLAPALKRAGFDVLITANNHCMDFGASGLLRTIRILNQTGIGHTGTFESAKSAKQYLIKNVKGMKVGILSYTEGLNGFSLPANKSWMVNLTRTKKMLQDIRHMKKNADLVVVYLHFGREYSHTPNLRQKRLANLLLNQGAHIILGSHPHVLQPMIARGKKQVVIYSLGNFVCTKLKGNPHTQSGIILNVKVKKNENGNIVISGIHCIPTFVHRKTEGGRNQTEVVPFSKIETEPHKQLQSMLSKTKKILKGYV